VLVEDTTRDRERYAITRSIRRHIAELGSAIPWQTPDGRRTTQPPGLYLRLFAVVRPGSAPGIGGASSVPRHERNPIRVQVLDLIAEISRVVLAIEASQRQLMGFGALQRYSSPHRRRKWGLHARDRAAGGAQPDDRVLDALDWLGAAAEHLETDAPEQWLHDVAVALDGLARDARRLCGLSAPTVPGVVCPYCKQPSILTNPLDGNVATCANPDCRDETGVRPRWAGPVQWAAIDRAS
jgi:hypothetical protein